MAPPHVRGEDNAKTGQARPERETPPRAWGRRLRTARHERNGRNTPTCVGKTDSRVKLEFTLEKHPHVRGEDISKKSIDDTHRETPPRAWGRHMDGDASLDDWRNTPTCVGKTRHSSSRGGKHWKHPHVRGEDISKKSIDDTHRETPPRAWGRHMDGDASLDDWRNTPTCVGKTFYQSQELFFNKKHPHVRGEDYAFQEKGNTEIETPPRAWGRLTSRPLIST